MPGLPPAGKATEYKVRCLDLHGVIGTDGDGVPRWFRARCKNRRCCPRKDGHAAFHVWALTGDERGGYVTMYEPLRDVGELPTIPQRST